MEVTGAECLPHTYQELLDYLGQLEYGATGGYRLDTVQDFMIELGIKPFVHILEISIFSRNHVIVRPTKIMNNLLKDCKICTFKVIFQHKKSMASF